MCVTLATNAQFSQSEALESVPGAGVDVLGDEALGGDTAGLLACLRKALHPQRFQGLPITAVATRVCSQRCGRYQVSAVWRDLDNWAQPYS